MLSLLLLSTLALGADLPDIDAPHKTGADAPADAAVVVGIEEYVFVADVPYAERDAQAFYDFLVYTRGVPSEQVRLLAGSAGREQIVEALEAAAEQVQRGGTLWVYFAGHGAADTSTGERLLLGDDVRQDPAAFGARAVPLSTVEEIAGDRELMLVLDACYNGLGRSGDELVAGKRFVVPAAALASRSGVAEWTAASADELSGPLEATRHGAFTYFAIGALRGWADGELDGARDGKVTAEEADLYVKRALRTVQVTTQTPVLTAPDASSLVLSPGTEAAPELTAGSVATGSSTASSGSSSPLGPVDATDAAAMDVFVQQIVDTCTAQNATGTEGDDLWYVRFKTKKGKAKGVWIADQRPETVAAMESSSTELPDMDPGRGTRAMCITREIKKHTYTNDKVVVQRTLSPSNVE